MKRPGAIVAGLFIVGARLAGGKWNTCDITLKGDHIALQYGAGVVKFRKVQIQPL